MEPDARKWYHKKRYILPAGLFATSMVVASISEPATQPTMQDSSNDVHSVQILVNDNPVRKVPQVKNPDFEYIDNAEKVESKGSCNSNYSGCLKQHAGDYDCANGSGNGPNYTGAVQVIGYDEYDLDRNNDGWGCE